jgi:hypothetical protein
MRLPTDQTTANDHGKDTHLCHADHELPIHACRELLNF